MCGIWLLLAKKNVDLYDIKYKDAFSRIKARGPDKSSYEVNESFIIGFHRLAIMDKSEKGDQPFKYISENRKVYVICNGEIYNFRYLIDKYKLISVSGSDCEVIMHLYMKDIDFVNELEGEFAFIIVDILDDKLKVTLGNDRFGIRPMFVYEDDNTICVSSELKGIYMNGGKVDRFKPRHTAEIEDNKIKYKQYYSIDDVKTSIYDIDEARKLIKECFEKVISGIIDSDRPIGCLLSGGLDSSLVASHVAKICKNVRTFSIGLPGASDEYYAKLVAKHIGSNHTHIVIEEKDFLEAIKEIIYTTETIDITTIRASTPQLLISKWISKNTDIKVLLVGDGSDELTSGYQYFHIAPSAEEMHKENIRLLNDIHLYDGLRADRCVAGNGLECRFPFLDHRFVELYLSIDPKLRMPQNGLEKFLLRSSFDDMSLHDILPKEVLYRSKVAFSDGCSSKNRSWFEILQEKVDKLYSDDTFLDLSKKYIHLPPYTKESLWFREQFTEMYGDKASQIYKYYWLPKWCNAKDPSARTLQFYKE